MNDIPISTRWLNEAADTTNQSIAQNVYLIHCPKTQSKGTGFVIPTGHIVTNWHVIKDCGANEIKAISTNGTQIDFSSLIADENRDLAVLKPTIDLGGGLEIHDETEKVQTKVLTWGHPLAYNGPSPILSVGYIAGFNEYKKNATAPVVKRYVINGAFNPGNSGGPLLADRTAKVVGVVVAKHAPIPDFLQAALDALNNNKSGFMYTASHNGVSKGSFSEAQLVGMLLDHQRKLTQVMIGEAISSSELIAFLQESKIFPENNDIRGLSAIFTRFLNSVSDLTDKFYDTFGLFLVVGGSLLAAMAIGEFPGHSRIGTDSGEYSIIVMKHPVWLKLGLIAVVVGFIVQLSDNLMTVHKLGGKRLYWALGALLVYLILFVMAN